MMFTVMQIPDDSSAVTVFSSHKLRNTNFCHSIMILISLDSFLHLSDYRDCASLEFFSPSARLWRLHFPWIPFSICLAVRDCVLLYFYFTPASSSMRSSWLYFAVRSPRHGAPVLICPQFNATDRSAIKLSSVSPER